MASSPEAAASGARPEGCDVHPQLWQACAGSMCAVPPVGAAVYYFPQGHAEQAAAAAAAVDLRASLGGVSPFVPCRVVAVRRMADPDTDNIFATIRLVPLGPVEPVADVGEAGRGGARAGDDGDQRRRPGPLSFAKKLTLSDTNNGGACFSVPRACARTIFPELDYSLNPPMQFVSARDVHGVEWTFRHVFRGSPRRHLLTTGWSNFLNSKKPQAGDSVVFVRDEDGQVLVGLRRATKPVFSGGGGEGPAAPLAARGNAGSPSPGAAAAVSAEDVVEAARLAAAGQPFEVVHCPRACGGFSVPEFCVRAATVRESMDVRWCRGLRFKMAVEMEDLSRIRWFRGTIAGVEPADTARWPQSPWRLLEVTWDEPELRRNVTRVCPWVVELVSSMPKLPPPSKKPRTTPYTESYSESRPLFDPAALPPAHPLPLAPSHDRNRHGFVPSFPFPDSIAAAAAAGIEGARHPQFAPFFSDLHFSSLLFSGLRPGDHHGAPPAPRIATDLKIGSPTTTLAPSPGDDVKPPGIKLFGRAILTEEQMKSSNSSGSSNPDCDDEKPSSTSDRSSSDGTHGSPAKKSPPPSWRLWWSGDSPASEFGLEPGQCKVFVESDAVGRNLDLSALGSFEELCARLSGMFGTDSADLTSHMLYRTIAGEVKHVGDEPFSAFVKSARRITILSDAGSDNTGNR